MRKKAALHNLGCKVNAYETEAMQELLEDSGYEIVPFMKGRYIYYQYLYGDEHGGSKIPPDAAPRPEDEPGRHRGGLRLLCAGKAGGSSGLRGHCDWQ